jgi:hypothetical protein
LFGKGLSNAKLRGFSRADIIFLCQRTWQRGQKICFKFINMLHVNACCAPRGQLISSWDSIACKINHKLFSEFFRFAFFLLLKCFYFLWLLNSFLF